jgi:hypothetical protein
MEQEATEITESAVEVSLFSLFSAVRVFLDEAKEEGFKVPRDRASIRLKKLSKSSGHSR